MIKIIADSSSNIYAVEGVNYSFVPLKIVTEEKEFVDEGIEKAREMCDVLAVSEKSSTSCPNIQEWLEAFDKDDDNIAFTISSNLSGSYNACMQAKAIFEEENQHKVAVIDSLSTGPEMELLIEKTKELIDKGLTFFELEKAIRIYQATTHIYFLTSSVHNLVSKGRIPGFIGKAISVLKISMVGMGTFEGKIKIIHERRNSKKAIEFIMEKMKERGFKGGKVRISHCFNEENSRYMIEKIRNMHENCSIVLRQCGLLCSYYVEEHGIIVAFEGEEDDL